MKRKPRVPSPTMKHPAKRRYLKLTQIEERFALLLLLLQHNFDKVIQRTKARRR
jgi:hypothetical protein